MAVLGLDPRIGPATHVFTGSSRQSGLGDWQITGTRQLWHAAGRDGGMVICLLELVLHVGPQDQAFNTERTKDHGAARRQAGIPVTYKGVQVLTYLRMSGLRLGLLFNFHARLLKDGLRRFVV